MRSRGVRQGAIRSAPSFLTHFIAATLVISQR